MFEDDYRAARLPMLPALVGAQRAAAAIHANTVGLVIASLALVPFLGSAYGVAAVLAGAGFLACTSALRRCVDERHAWRTFKASGLYLLLLLVGIVLSTF